MTIVVLNECYPLWRTTTASSLYGNLKKRCVVHFATVISYSVSHLSSDFHSRQTYIYHVKWTAKSCIQTFKLFTFHTFKLCFEVRNRRDY